MQRHTLPVSLEALKRFRAPIGNDSEARWARRRCDTCVIFVHGFGGHAVSTWGDFASLAVEHPSFARCDLVFLGYESRGHSAHINRGVIYQAVKALSEHNRELLAATNGPRRPKGFRYTKILLVGHSLGGAIVRDVAMTAKIEADDCADLLEMGLFAPAHMGASAIGLVESGIGFTGLAQLTKSAVTALFPALKDLEAGSTYLSRLLETARRIGVHGTTRARFVAHAMGDRVVLQDPFFEDPPPLPYPNNSHVKCCKPIRGGFQLPIEDVAAVVR